MDVETNSTLTGYFIETVDRSHDKTFIAEVGGGLQSMREIQMNAMLIAAAPDLLEALSALLDESMVFDFENTIPTRGEKMALSAIEKVLK